MPLLTMVPSPTPPKAGVRTPAPAKAQGALPRARPADSPLKQRGNLKGEVIKEILWACAAPHPAGAQGAPPRARPTDSPIKTEKSRRTKDDVEDVGAARPHTLRQG